MRKLFEKNNGPVMELADMADLSPAALWRAGSTPVRATYGRMAELVDAPHSKCGVRKGVWVRVPL